MNILFVCTGNTCRSAMAAAIMDKIASENDLPLRIESAGLLAEDGAPASENAVKVLAQNGIDLSEHRAKQVTEEMLCESDIVIAMTEAHKQILASAAGDKVFTLSEFAGSYGDIKDPFGGDLEEYEETANEIYDFLVDAAERIADMEEK